jgi:hypothetical protein
LALALTVLLLAMLYILCPSLLTPLAIAAASTAGLAVVVLLALALLLCRLGFCGFWGIVIWALRWAIVLGLIIALVLLLTVGLVALPVVMCVALAALGYGIICGLLIVWLARRGCTIPSGFSWP